MPLYSAILMRSHAPVPVMRLMALVAAAIVTVPCVAYAQVVPGEGSAIGSLAADRARLRQVTGEVPLLERPDSVGAGARFVLPTLVLIRNSQLPSLGNDGALWAGRGTNVSVTGGAVFTRMVGGIGVRAALLPEITYAENLPFQILPGRSPDRSAFSSPWHLGTSSADLPLRFGDQSIRTVGLGQSALTFTAGSVAFGASTANEWWGPALRNTLVLSNNAAGIPRLFVRTAHPLGTSVGWFDARLIAGALTESPYFDRDPTNDARSVSGLLFTFRPAVDSGLLLGLSRLVIAPVSSNGAVLGHGFDVLTRWEPVRAPSDTLANGSSAQHTDQIFSLFGRWVFPRSGLEVYGEWARTELPRSLREYLEAPQSTQAYTLGLQWARPAGIGKRIRLQGEATYLEQTIIWPDRPTQDYYTGRAAVQGFTQRGQVLGAAIGPGSSMQFLAADWIAGVSQVGAFVSRTRTENDALYRQAFPTPTRHDVAYAAGLRGGRVVPRLEVSGELVASRRLNYLFQNHFLLAEPVIATDVSNLSLVLRVAPR